MTKVSVLSGTQAILEAFEDAGPEDIRPVSAVTLDAASAYIIMFCPPGKRVFTFKDYYANGKPEKIPVEYPYWYFAVYYSAAYGHGQVSLSSWSVRPEDDWTNFQYAIPVPLPNHGDGATVCNGDGARWKNQNVKEGFSKAAGSLFTNGFTYYGLTMARKNRSFDHMVKWAEKNGVIIPPPTKPTKTSYQLGYSWRAGGRNGIPIFKDYMAFMAKLGEADGVWRTSQRGLKALGKPCQAWSAYNPKATPRTVTRVGFSSIEYDPKKLISRFVKESEGAPPILRTLYQPDNW